MFFCFWRDAHRFDFIDKREYDECRSECPDGAQRGPAELNHELAYVAMDQASDALTGVSKIAGGAYTVPAAP